MAVAVTRQDLDAEGLRQAAKRCRDDGAAARRMLAIAHILEGRSRSEAAHATGMDRQTLRDWVHRYNAEGIDGLTNRPVKGASPRLTADQLAKLDDIVKAGPDPEKDKVVRWRLSDLKRVIHEEFSVEFHERSVGKILKKLNFRKISVRPRNPKSDPEAQETFKKTFRTS